MRHGEVITTRRDTVHNTITTIVERPYNHKNNIGPLKPGDIIRAIATRNGLNIFQINYTVTEPVKHSHNLYCVEKIYILESPAVMRLSTGETDILSDTVVHRNGIKSGAERPRNERNDIGPLNVGDRITVSFLLNSVEQNLFEHTIETPAPDDKKLALRLNLDFVESM